MLPTIEDKSTIIIEKLLNYKLNTIKKGHVVIAKSPVKPDVEICKRVKHLEGEEVYGIVIPKNHVWLEGDNACKLIFF